MPQIMYVCGGGILLMLAVGGVSINDITLLKNSPAKTDTDWKNDISGCLVCPLFHFLFLFLSEILRKRIKIYSSFLRGLTLFWA